LTTILILVKAAASEILALLKTIPLRAIHIVCTAWKMQDNRTSRIKLCWLPQQSNNDKAEKRSIEQSNMQTTYLQIPCANWHDRNKWSEVS
jgi:hypothetical protein